MPGMQIPDPGTDPDAAAADIYGIGDIMPLDPDDNCSNDVEEYIRSRLKEMHRVLAAFGRKIEDICLDGVLRVDLIIIQPLRDVAYDAYRVSCKAHAKAAEHVFRQNNTNYGHPDRSVAFSKIDVHELRVPEAKQYVEDHIDLCKQTGITRTEIICGWGKHSQYGVARIKPVLKQYFEEMGIKYMEPANVGRLIVYLLPHNIGNEIGNSALVSGMNNG